LLISMISRVALMNSNPGVHSSSIHSSARYVKDRAFKEVSEIWRGEFPSV
jgi:hypothetical protein